MNRRQKRKKAWFGAKCVFVFAAGGINPEQLYEERVILLKAFDFDHALAQAGKEAHSYAADVDCAYTGFVSVFQIMDDEILEGTEVYSLMRTSPLSSNDYLDRFHDTGTERTRKAAGGRVLTDEEIEHVMNWLAKHDKRDLSDR